MGAIIVRVVGVLVCTLLLCCTDNVRTPASTTRQHLDTIDVRSTAPTSLQQFDTIPIDTTWLLWRHSTDTIGLRSLLYELQYELLQIRYSYKTSHKRSEPDSSALYFLPNIWANDSTKALFGICELILVRSTGVASSAINIRADGTVRYMGSHDAEPEEIRIGTLDTGEVKQLFEVADRLRLFELRNEYGYESNTSDVGGSLEIMIITKHKQKLISEAWGTGPAQLWAIQELIDGRLEHVQWNEDQTTQR